MKNKWSWLVLACYTEIREREGRTRRERGAARSASPGARAAPRGATRTAPPSAVPALPLQETPHAGLDTDFISRFNNLLVPRANRGAAFTFRPV